MESNFQSNGGVYSNFKKVFTSFFKKKQILAEIGGHFPNKNGVKKYSDGCVFGVVSSCSNYLNPDLKVSTGKNMFFVYLNSNITTS